MVEIFTVRHFQAAATANIKAIKATAGTTNLFMPAPSLVNRLRKERTEYLFQLRLRINAHDPAIVHPRNGIGKTKNAIVVGDYDHCSVRPHGFRCQ